MKDAPKQADIIFIQGSSKAAVSEPASDIYQKKLAKILLPSGKYSSKLTCFPNEKLGECHYSGVYETDWHFCSEVLKENGVPETAILKENRATNTYENAFFSRKITDLKNLNIEKAIICCQAFHARRALMTYS
ncbi:YdcF family protein [uncultured Vagococcus sp.]|uniref:YdcF family protein n=1 Tax=uncultured Vagococcus sp. TaxID=189676 RepID=UPI0028D8E9CF|nr:YdcF family protein [uncultured Vagococcus sp.]